jgi:TIR domain
MSRSRAFVEGYEADVFISYARLDDKPVMGDPVGWVSQLHTELINQLPVYLGAEAQIWRDQEEIRNNEDFSKKISYQLENSATLIAILSESFIKREWCLREVQEFAAHADKRFGVYIDGDKKRIFSVERMPVSREVLPNQLEGTTTYRFFEGGRILQPTVDNQHRAKYLACIHDLVYDIARVLKLLAKTSAPGAAPVNAEPEAPAVYLAQAASSLDDQAAEIRRDLTERGFRVLPNGDLPQRAARLKEEVTANLAKCALSIHLVGADYGFVPEGEASKSNVWLQHELALQRAQGEDFACLVWVARDTSVTDERQKAFLSYLEEDDTAQKHTDLLQNCGLEELKGEAHDKLAQIAEKRAKAAAAKLAPKPQPAPAPVAAARATAFDDPPFVYVICEDVSRKSPDLVAVRKHLLARGYDPVFLEKGEDGGATLQQHIENLNLCDACLIFYDRNMPDWLAQKLGDLRKYLRGRARPVLARAVYHVPVAGADEEIETNAALVLSGAGGFAPAQLAPFIEKIDAALKGHAS